MGDEDQARANPGAGALDGSGIEAIAPFRWTARLLTVQPVTAIIAVCVLAVLRSGIEFIDGTSSLLVITDNLPEPTTGFAGTAVIGPWLVHTAHLATGAGWLTLHAVATVAVLATVVVLARRSVEGTAQQLLLIAAIAGSGAVVVTFQSIGSYDIWMVLAAALLVLPRSWAPSIAAGLLMGATNAEQGVVALVAFGLCAWALDRSALNRVAGALAAVVLARAGIQWWYAVNDVAVESRASLFGDYLDRSLRGFGSRWTFQVYSWFSASWVFVLDGLHRMAGRARLAVIAGLIALPALFSITTLDGTRVFTTISFPAFLLVARWTVRRLSERGLAERMTVVLTAIMLVTPGLMTFPDREIILPWEAVYGSVRDRLPF